ncbi:MAG TPA: DinB family protein [Vicinamibacterales bacterium]|jgi:hypothetical protein|nr:DinB family protein [Vicinamibacterales bacterium]
MKTETTDRTDDRLVRAQLADLLTWSQAHVGFEEAVKGIPARLRGVVPQGFAHSVWDLVEHMRIAQADILDFCRNSKYREKRWPEDYWPKAHAPKSAAAWNAALVGFRRDRKAVQRMATDREIDLVAKIPHGSGQTYLREILLVADHNAHHVAQIIDLRRAIGIWR